MKIDKIRIQNFKVFQDITLDMNASDIVVFDGPNGFGKTTIYDAIELVFTGKIRRYLDLKNLVVDGREVDLAHPFLHENRVGEDIVITIEFTKNEKRYVLGRLAKTERIRGIDFSVYKLFEKDHFLAEAGTLIEDEGLFLKDLLGNDYSSNFQFLNYVEQEESNFLLKHPDKARKNHIDHLFDLTAFEAKIERIGQLKKRIEGVNTIRKQEIAGLKIEITNLKSNLDRTTEPTAYIRLFESIEVVWDKETTDPNAFNYLDVAGADGILDELKKLVERKIIFSQYRINRVVDYLLNKENLTRDFLRFYNFLQNKEELRTLRTTVIQQRNLVKQLGSLNSDNLDQEVYLASFEFIPEDLKIAFANAKQGLISEFSALSGLDKIYSDIFRSRNELQIEIENLQDVGSPVTDCMLCGYNWGNVEALLLQIQNKSEEMRKVNSEKNNQLQASLLIFKTGLVQRLMDTITENISSLHYNEEFISRLLEIESDSFSDILRSLAFLKVDYGKYLSNEQLGDVSAAFESLRNELLLLKNTEGDELIENYFSNYFREYFNNEFNQLDALSVENIEAKRKYLIHEWYLSQNTMLQEKSAKLKEITVIWEEANTLGKNLDKLRKTYTNSLKKYQQQIIKDIEIVFHVFSGRIMQSFQGGIGLFIFPDNGIRFQTDARKAYDAVFTMSSGQLSALIIAFTLALHKKYSQNKMVLIDDPVQTMDELNMYGFIDLLRNEFSDNQILMSTHEDMMSAFMRYKFKNYNLKEKRINLKELSV
ncbi:AAA family ATPase [Chitinophaga sp. Cy-1792]|uniref:ATP-binding protein n=1 Tax=Chitinophaga sp. Cy-1792 TaxID=2608339 RepID=UPI001420139A|nr:AAA family ATPase [Chitinophaga sp. Cy-1792]NIG54868.1 AAA family ATPase [Chitinophaga sp. Cy-1792]